MKVSWSCDDVMFSLCCREDIDEISLMLSKESVCKYLFFGPNTVEVTRSYFLPLIEQIEQSVKNNKIPSSPVFTIRSKSSGAFIGQCALLQEEFTNGSLLIGVQLDEPWWGKKIGSLAVSFLIWFGFVMLDAHRLSGDTVESNVGSLKAMKRAGFVVEGIQRQYWNARGSLHNRVLLGLIRSDISKARLDELDSLFLN